MTEFRLTGGTDFKEFARALRKASNGRELRKNLTKQLQAVAKPVVADVRAEVLAIKTKGVKGFGTRRRESAFATRTRGRGARGGHGLRATIARGAKSKVFYAGRRTGLRVWIDPSVLPTSQRNLPVHLDNPRGWRHPVWGNREVWVRQTGDPYFRRTMQRHTREVRAALEAAFNETLKELQ